MYASESRSDTVQQQGGKPDRRQAKSAFLPERVIFVMSKSQKSV